MKGARGLLISITGGRDLTLYEVDEAATRIREEVDQEANIIVGATFDESLDGIIRVSVVATGIDQIATASPLQQPFSIDSRLAELTQKLRSNSQRLAERMERTEQGLRPAVDPGPPAAPDTLIEAPRASAKATAPAPPAAAFEDVVLRPMPQKPSLFLEPVEEHPPAPPVDPPESRTFIPPQPDRPSPRPPRMPRMEDLPLPAQNEIRASRGEMPETGTEKRRTSLLQRLASVGLGRREDDEPTKTVAPRQLMPPASRSAPRRNDNPRADPPPEDGSPISEYAKRHPAPRPAPQGIDPHGRSVPAATAIDEEHLEIPAFLRRQAN
jgi:cell division protein FtsZ